MPYTRPSRREEFAVAIICALELEYDAVSYTFDQFWDENGDPYGRAAGDLNVYTTGRIGEHNVVLTLLSHTGKANAASAAASIRSSYSEIRLALLVGVCGGVPQAPNHNKDGILLGDVVIGKSVIQYDFGRQYPDKFVRKNDLKDNLRNPVKDIRNLLVTFNTDRGRRLLQQRTLNFLRQLQAKVARERPDKYRYPGIEEDKLFAPNYRHKHHFPRTCICRYCHRTSDPVCDEALKSYCDELGCDETSTVQRKYLKIGQHLGHNREPSIHVGAIASGDCVMRSGEDRDRLWEEEGIIAFDMEGAGVWEEVPCIIVKGVSDYADCHKTKKWQNFAAGVAASASRAVLENYIRPDRTPEGRSVHARGGDARGGDASGSNARGGDARGGDASGGTARGGDARGGKARGDDTRVAVILAALIIALVAGALSISHLLSPFSVFSSCNRPLAGTVQQPQEFRESRA